ncbi:hypothetical protein C8F04DRAFT_1255990 [Mycena alexandri]|uniref:Uncharacterized protein n=1 Tax=Mycena alexandri TaxID=1745969 RepID=A0AAD6T3Z5_9AGAR|nr:hypothetical protein C8F04DRAFT_1255990 [Mycena alexandri]
MFTLVTHLDIYDHPANFPTNDFAHWWPLLVHLPILTHVSIYKGIAMTLVPKALVLCKKLEVPICMHIEDQSEVPEVVHDQRFLHVAAQLGISGRLGGWGKGRVGFLGSSRGVHWEENAAAKSNPLKANL